MLAKKHKIYRVFDTRTGNKNEDIPVRVNLKRGGECAAPKEASMNDDKLDAAKGIFWGMISASIFWLIIILAIVEVFGK